MPDHRTDTLSGALRRVLPALALLVVGCAADPQRLNDASRSPSEIGPQDGARSSPDWTELIDALRPEADGAPALDAVRPDQGQSGSVFAADGCAARPPLAAVPALPLWSENPSKVVYVAAKDSTSPLKAQASYKCTGTGDHSIINQALSSVGAKGKVVLLDGHFSCSGIISPQTQTTLEGQGADQTFLTFTNDGRIEVQKEYVVLRRFHFRGTGYSAAKWLAPLHVIRSHVDLYDLTGTADSSVQAVFYLHRDEKTPGYGVHALQDVDFVGCKVDRPGTYGFLLNSWPYHLLIKDVRFINCQAIDCGRDGHFNPWVTGFDIAETNDAENILIESCLAEGTLESGFHSEWGPDTPIRVSNVRYKNCISRGNGRKWAYHHRSGHCEDSDLKDKLCFGAGFFTGIGKNVVHETCCAERNGLAGFSVQATTGVKYSNCADFYTGIPGDKTTIANPASFRLDYTPGSIDSQGSGSWAFYYQSKPTVTIESCRSVNSYQYAYRELHPIKYTQISSFQQINPARK